MKLFSRNVERAYVQTGFRNITNAVLISELLGPKDGPYRDKICWKPLVFEVSPRRGG